MSFSDCPFCKRIRMGQYTNMHISTGTTVYSFPPIDPVVHGHMLFVPKDHVFHAAEDPKVTATTMYFAAKYAAEITYRDDGPDVNIITSIGKHATQTVWHLHVHVVPRRADDGLLLPWSKLPESL